MTRYSEEELIEWIRARGWPDHPGLVRGIGDDGAVCRPAPGSDLVVTTDLLVEGRHFLRETTPPGDLGWKVGAANLSDIAAMGARPTAFFLSAAFPASEQEFFQEVMTGLREILHRYETPLAGGDLSAAGGFIFAATVLGEVPRGAALLRAGARPGDAVFLTGEPGYSGAGLRLLSAGYRKIGPDRLAVPGAAAVALSNPSGPGVYVQKHLRPEPRLAAGCFLRESGAVTAAIDTSDGLAKDLRQICAQSGVGARLFESFLLVLTGEGPVTLADVLGGGEDYELLFTVDPAREEEFLTAWHRREGFPPLHRVGCICAEHPGEVLLQGPEGERPLPVRGFDHFA